MTKRKILTMNEIRARKAIKEYSSNVDARDYLISLYADRLVADWEKSWQVVLELNGNLGQFVSQMDYCTAKWVKHTSQIFTDIEQTRVVRQEAELFYKRHGI